MSSESRVVMSIVDQPIRRLRARPKPAIYSLAGLRRDYEGWCLFFILLALLFAPQLGSKGILIALAGMAVLLGAEWHRTVDSIWTRAVLLLLPLFAVASFLWSQHPPETLRYSLQALLAVVVGLRLSRPANADRVPRAVFAAFGFYMLFSLALGHSVHVGAGDEHAFSGLNGSKNFLADMAVISLLSSGYVLMTSWRQGAVAWFGTAGLLMLIDAFVLIQAHSAGALVGAVGAVGFLFGLAFVDRFGANGRVYAALAAVVIGFILFLTRDIIESAITGLFTNVFHKDSTLTGRAYLWYRAAALVKAHPWLGTGFGAFWVQGDLEPEGLWRYTFVESRSGITFHNTYYNTLVDMGWIGLAIFVSTSIVGIVAAGRAYLTRGGAALCFWLALLEYEFARSPIEAVGLEPLGFTSLLIYAGLGWGFAQGVSRTEGLTASRIKGMAAAAMPAGGPMRIRTPLTRKRRASPTRARGA